MKNHHEALSAALPVEGNPPLIGRELAQEELIVRAAEKLEERAETLARALTASEAIIAMAVDMATATLSGGAHESAVETLRVAKEAAAKTLQIAKEDAREVLALAREVAKDLLALAESKASSSVAK